jgi:hypothetical protein
MSIVHELAIILKRAEEKVKARPERLRHDDPYYVPRASSHETSASQSSNSGQQKKAS